MFIELKTTLRCDNPRLLLNTEQITAIRPTGTVCEIWMQDERIEVQESYDQVRSLLRMARLLA